MDARAKLAERRRQEARECAIPNESASVRPFADIPGTFKVQKGQERWLFDANRLAEARKQWDGLKRKFGIDQSEEREILERQQASKLCQQIGTSIMM
jgi:hypothetical protein